MASIAHVFTLSKVAQLENRFSIIRGFVLHESTQYATYLPKHEDAPITHLPRSHSRSLAVRSSQSDPDPFYQVCLYIYMTCSNRALYNTVVCGGHAKLWSMHFHRTTEVRWKTAGSKTDFHKVTRGTVHYGSGKVPVSNLETCVRALLGHV